jgi:hypothetical protein
MMPAGMNLAGVTHAISAVQFSRDLSMPVMFGGGLAWVTGVEPATFGFGDRCSTC